MKRRSHPTRKVTPDVAEKAWLFYQRQQNVMALSRYLGVNKMTAYKLVHDGYRRIGIEPLAERHRRMAALATQKADTKLADVLAERIVQARKTMEAVDRAAEILSARLATIARAVDTRHMPPDVRRLTLREVVALLKHAAVAIDQLTRHSAFCYHGGSDKMHTVKTDPIGELMASEIPGKSEEDMEFYIKHRRWPDCREPAAEPKQMDLPDGG